MARKKLRGESDMCSFSIYISKDERDRIQREADELEAFLQSILMKRSRW